MYLPNNKQVSKLMIYFHGIGEDVRGILSEPYQIRKKLGFNVLCVEYPGYGINFYKGVCSEQQMVNDACSVVDFVLTVSDLTPSDIVIYGRSMGTGVATSLAFKMRHNPFYKVVLVSPYFSVKDLFRSHAGCFGRAVIRQRFDTASRIAEVNCPLLIIHGEGDTLVPVEQSHRLIELADPAVSKLEVRPRINHTNYNV